MVNKTVTVFKNQLIRFPVIALSNSYFDPDCVLISRITFTKVSKYKSSQRDFRAIFSR